MVNLNELAREVTLAEGGKVNLSIAQVKEVIKLTLKELAKYDYEEVDKLLDRYVDK
jgi:predicted DNA-binding antitoxin AbrB/MazE fold protein